MSYVWSRLGDVTNFIDPFAGSHCAILLRPDDHAAKVETVNDYNCYISNFWRAVSHDPEHVALYADSPVNEADLRARHMWLVGVADIPPLIPSAWRDEPARSAYLAGYRRDGQSNAAAFRSRIMADPDYYDAKFAGWWVWGQCCWIGGGWCEYSEGSNLKKTVPDLSGHNGAANGRGVLAAAGNQIPALSGDSGATGRGVHASGSQASKLNRGGHASMPGVLKANQSRVPTVRKRPIIGGRSSDSYGHGVHKVNNQNRPQLADAYSRGRGVHSNDSLSSCDARRQWLETWFAALADRFRHVRVCCGDWLRVCDSPSVTTRLGLTGIWLDPPYRKRLKSGAANRDGTLYATDRGQDTDDLVDRVIAYCVERGGDPEMRIGVCCLEGEGYEVLREHGWDEYAWTSNGGYANRGEARNKNRDRERIWFSPHCLSGRAERTLFD